MSFNKLFFDSVEVKVDGDALTVNPHFLCPRCGNQKQPATRPTAKLASSVSILKAAEDLDKNGAETFTLPCCGLQITLYIAVFKSKDGKAPPSVCVSSETIKQDWHKQSSATVEAVPG